MYIHKACMSIWLKAYLKKKKIKNATYAKKPDICICKGKSYIFVQRQVLKVYHSKAANVSLKSILYTCLKTRLQAETYNLRKKTLHTCARGGSLLVQSCVPVALDISIYVIKPKNNCHPPSNLVLEKMSETNNSLEISRMPQAQNCKTFSYAANKRNRMHVLVSPVCRDKPGNTVKRKVTQCLVAMHGPCLSPHVVYVKDTLLSLFSLAAISRSTWEQTDAKEAERHSCTN